jgi:hypothetical protein
MDILGTKMGNIILVVTNIFFNKIQNRLSVLLVQEKQIKKKEFFMNQKRYMFH